MEEIRKRIEELRELRRQLGSKREELEQLLVNGALDLEKIVPVLRSVYLAKENTNFVVVDIDDCDRGRSCCVRLANVAGGSDQVDSIVIDVPQQMINLLDDLLDSLYDCPCNQNQTVEKWEPEERFGG